MSGMFELMEVLTQNVDARRAGSHKQVIVIVAMIDLMFAKEHADILCVRIQCAPAGHTFVSPSNQGMQMQCLMQMHIATCANSRCMTAVPSKMLLDSARAYHSAVAQC